jgi:hypothetical protein
MGFSDGYSQTNHVMLVMCFKKERIQEEEEEEEATVGQSNRKTRKTGEEKVLQIYQGLALVEESCC